LASEFWRAFKRSNTLSFLDFFDSGHAGLAEAFDKEAAWARTRRSVKERRVQILAGADEFETAAQVDTALAARSLAERRRMHVYQQRWPGCLADTNQNPEFRPLHSRGTDAGTIIHNTGLVVTFVPGSALQPSSHAV